MKAWRLGGVGALVLGVALLVHPAEGFAETGYWQGVAVKIETALHDALTRYQEGDAEAARRALTRAYFGVFEGSKMEAALRMEQGAKHTYGVERQFGVLRKAIKGGADAEELRRAVEALAATLRDDATALDRARIAPEVFKTGE